MKQITQETQPFIASSLLENKANPSRQRETAWHHLVTTTSIGAGLFTPQKNIQLELITACERGDIKAVQLAIQNGAKPFYPGLEEKQKQPLGAAVWGMNPAVVQYLLKQMGEVTPITWSECEKHNRQHYNNEVFLFEKFNLKSFGGWSMSLEKLEKMDSMLFIREFHLEACREIFPKEGFKSFRDLVMYTEDMDLCENTYGSLSMAQELTKIEASFADLGTQIKSAIEKAKKPEVAVTQNIPSSLALTQ